MHYVQVVHCVKVAHAVDCVQALHCEEAVHAVDCVQTLHCVQAVHAVNFGHAVQTLTQTQTQP